MTTTLIINTAALAPHAKHAISSGKVPYSWRTYALQNFIIPTYVNSPWIDQLIVAGHYRAGVGYEYVPVEPEHHSWADCIPQRQAGFERATGDTLIFQHDDHLLELTEAAFPEADVVSPDRKTRTLDPAGERLNSGWGKYIDGHAAIYRREVIERCPWKDVPTVFTLDMEHTKQIQDAGFKVMWTEKVVAWDVEYGATPWL